MTSRAWTRRGLIDCHVHTAPDVIERRRTAEQLAAEAARAGLHGFVLKSHEGSTAMLAAQLDALHADVHVYGSVTLNEPAGGLNPAAVRSAGALGARVVWMPTTSARNHLAFFGTGVEGEGISILDDRGRMLPVVGDVLSEARRAGMAVATGHLSSAESVALASYAARGGFPMDRFVVTHCDMPVTRLDGDEQRYVAELGGFLERLFMVVLSIARLASPDAMEAGTPYTGRSRLLEDGVGLEELLERIRATGVRRSIFSSDLGQAGNPDPVAGIDGACRLLLDAGVTRAELHAMTVAGPRTVLGLPAETSFPTAPLMATSKE